MARTLPPIPTETKIVDRFGAVTLFFMQVWETLRASFLVVAAAATLQLTEQSAAIATTAVYTTLSAGLYRLSYYVRKTAIDGVSSSLTVTLGWVEGIAQTEVQAALAADAVTAQQTGNKVVWADANTDLTIAVAYASNTPAAMKFRLDALVEQIA